MFLGQRAVLLSNVKASSERARRACNFINYSIPYAPKAISAALLPSEELCTAHI